MKASINVCVFTATDILDVKYSISGYPHSGQWCLLPVGAIVTSVMALKTDTSLVLAPGPLLSHQFLFT